MPTLTCTELYTDADGLARFREKTIPLSEGDAVTALSALLPAHACQWRRSAVGFASGFHCTAAPQWTLILRGRMEIVLRDGSARVFAAGDFFYSNDIVPAGARFDPEVHGHRSRQLGEEALVTLFLKI
ncbi:MAG: hypothetical protein LBO00_09010 [Zoogloeaceae bacterium]|jgi:hypothetical protein|nr:hypothetical protein [Zoogloeaceae bacterium]